MCCCSLSRWVCVCVCALSIYPTVGHIQSLTRKQTVPSTIHKSAQLCGAAAAVAVAAFSRQVDRVCVCVCECSSFSLSQRVNVSVFVCLCIYLSVCSSIFEMCVPIRGERLAIESSFLTLTCHQPKRIFRFCVSFAPSASQMFVVNYFRFVLFCLLLFS